MTKIARNNLGNFLVICLVFLTVTGWIFSGWPKIWQNPPVPPEIQPVQAGTETIRPTNYDNAAGITTNPSYAYNGITTNSGDTNFISDKYPAIYYGCDEFNNDAWENKSQTWATATLCATIEREAATNDTAGVNIETSTEVEKHILLAQSNTLFAKQEVCQGLTSADWGGTGFPDIYDLRVTIDTEKVGGPDGKFLKIYDIRIDGGYTLPNITVGTTGSQTTNMNIPSTDNYVGGAFTFVRDASSANVTQIKISETDATLSADSYLSNVKLYYKQEAGCSASIPGDATAFNATGVGFTSEKSTVTGDSPMAVGTSQICVYVQLNVESEAPDGDSFDIEISNPSTEVTVSAGTVSPGTAVAIDGATTLQAAPAGSLTLSNLTNIQWGDAASGTTKNGTINCTITTTGTTYDVKVSKDQNLTSGINTIPSTSFTYTSSYNSGTPDSGVTYQTSSTQFATTPGTNVASVTAGTAADNLNINVNYTLVIPPTQTAASSYTATHTYTLAVQ